jgi:hypothetical protein
MNTMSANTLTKKIQDPKSYLYDKGHKPLTKSQEKSNPDTKGLAILIEKKLTAKDRKPALPTGTPTVANLGHFKSVLNPGPNLPANSNPMSSKMPNASTNFSTKQPTAKNTDRDHPMNIQSTPIQPKRGMAFENQVQEFDSCLRDTAGGGLTHSETAAKSVTLKDGQKNYKGCSVNVFSSPSGDTGNKKKPFSRKILSKKISKEENSMVCY